MPKDRERPGHISSLSTICRTKPASLLKGRPVKVNKIDLVVLVLKKINQFISLHNQRLGIELPFNPKKFENDLKYFREWFRLREEKQKAKFDFFYGQEVHQLPK